MARWLEVNVIIITFFYLGFFAEARFSKEGCERLENNRGRNIIRNEGRLCDHDL